MTAPRLEVARLESGRVVLEPLEPQHAEELGPVLDDEALHRFIGGQPLGAGDLLRRYERLARGGSPDGHQIWRNWVVRERSSGQAVGTVQATVRGDDAQLAWVIATTYQGRGLAKEAARLMATWLREQGVGVLRAHIHPEHEASMAVARSIGLAPTPVFVAGERLWESD